MPVVLQVEGFGRRFFRHSGLLRRSVVSSVKGDDVVTAATSRNETETYAVSSLKYAKDFHVRRRGTRIFLFLMLSVITF